MGIDINRLRQGEPVMCPLCSKGHLKPEHDVPADKASHFKCDYCNEKLILNIRFSKPSE